jgi:hypothetical protein
MDLSRQLLGNAMCKNLEVSESMGKAWVGSGGSDTSMTFQQVRNLQLELYASDCEETNGKAYD